ncbi:MAG: hypothetical protein ACKO34_03035 [Vampirovibrionales bacterium]
MMTVQPRPRFLTLHGSHDANSHSGSPSHVVGATLPPLPHAAVAPSSHSPFAPPQALVPYPIEVDAFHRGEGFSQHGSARPMPLQATPSRQRSASSSASPWPAWVQKLMPWLL